MSKKITKGPGFENYYKKCRANYPNFLNDFKESVHWFLQSPELVRNHDLERDHLKGYKSFSITEDIRVVYKETKDSYIFLRVGSHSEVY